MVGHQQFNVTPLEVHIDIPDIKTSESFLDKLDTMVNRVNIF